VRIQEIFGRVVGKKVDLTTKKSLSKHFRDMVLREAETIYEKG
jgi:predicted nucleotidyltransferase